MIIYKNQTVYDAAIERIEYLFDEFPNVIVGYSGGKDSTVVFNLCYMIATKKNRLPLNVMWIDQEAEWRGTVEMCEYVMTMEGVKPYWFQMPMVITNNASAFERYSYCWKDGDEDKWIHPKHPISIKENRYGTVRFHKLFKSIIDVEFKNRKACYIAGVRTDETPKRFVSLTQAPCYKWITWGNALNKKMGHYTFYPIYDWKHKDVWKAIYDNKWKYNYIYDEMFRRGESLKDMRISNLHHETSVKSLLLVQEIEPDTWERVADRIIGANTVKHLKSAAFTCPDELPSMFVSWKEYASHLIENMVNEEKNRIKLYSIMQKYDRVYIDDAINKAFYRAIVSTVLVSDWDHTLITNFHMHPEVYNYRRYREGKPYETKKSYQIKYLPKEAIIANR